jgi:hypothetical protein
MYPVWVGNRHKLPTTPPWDELTQRYSKVLRKPYMGSKRIINEFGKSGWSGVHVPQISLL